MNDGDRRSGQTDAGKWVIDKDLTAERVVLSFLQGQGSEVRLKLEEAEALGRALCDTVKSMNTKAR